MFCTLLSCPTYISGETSQPSQLPRYHNKITVEVREKPLRLDDSVRFFMYVCIYVLNNAVFILLQWVDVQTYRQGSAARHCRAPYRGS